jgi:predicted transcriptional regulator
METDNSIKTDDLPVIFKPGAEPNLDYVKNEKEIMDFQDDDQSNLNDFIMNKIRDQTKEMIKHEELPGPEIESETEVLCVDYVAYEHRIFQITKYCTNSDQKLRQLKLKINQFDIEEMKEVDNQNT